MYDFENRESNNRKYNDRCVDLNDNNGLKIITNRSNEKNEKYKKQ